MMLVLPSRRWRAFAILMLILVLPFEFRGLFRHPAGYDAARYAIDTVAVIGLTGYAFGRPMGPRVMWRVFAHLFALSTAAIVAGSLPRMAAAAAVLSHRPILGIGVATMAAPAIAISWFMAVALLRHGGWLRTPGPAPIDYRTLLG